MKFLFVGLICLMVGAAGLYIRGKRKFHRRNVAGVEEFKSYGLAVVTNFLESALGVVSFALLALGGLATVGGVLMLLYGSDA